MNGWARRRTLRFKIGGGRSRLAAPIRKWHWLRSGRALCGVEVGGVVDWTALDSRRVERALRPSGARCTTCATAARLLAVESDPPDWGPHGMAWQDFDDWTDDEAREDLDERRDRQRAEERERRW